MMAPVKEKDRVEENLGLVRAFARRYANRGVDFEDLYGAGCVGLVKAARGFDETKGFAFSTYAVPVILGEMKRLFRDDGSVKVSRRIKELYLKVLDESERFKAKTGREPKISELASLLNTSYEDISLALQAACPPMSLSVQGESENSDSEVLDIPAPPIEDNILTRLELNRALSRLEKRDADLIRLRYIEELSQQKTAERLNMTQVQVSRREKKILLTLRELLKVE